jgi:hypothetical protein
MKKILIFLFLNIFIFSSVFAITDEQQNKIDNLKKYLKSYRHWERTVKFIDDFIARYSNDLDSLKKIKNSLSRYIENSRWKLTSVQTQLLASYFLIKTIVGIDNLENKNNLDSTKEIEKVKVNWETFIIWNIKITPYIPDLDFSKNDVYGNWQVVYVSNTETLISAIKTAKPRTTIIMRDGDYNIHFQFPVKSYLTIKAEHKHKAVWKVTWNKDNSWLQTPNDSNFHHVNFVDFSIVPGDSWQCQFQQAVWQDDEWGHHIYFKGLKMSWLFWWLYSGLHADYWTIDWINWTNWTYSHMWYAMWTHHSVINSYFATWVHDQIAIRGYYPKWETWYWSTPEKNLFVEERWSNQWFLAKNDWTHYIAGNTFDKWSNSYKKLRTNNWWEWNHIVFAYALYDDPPRMWERTYMPPQNIVIRNNIFKSWWDKDVTPITIWAWQWINSWKPASINGIYILKNIFDWSKSDFIKPYNSKVDISKIDKVEWNKFNQ